MPPDFSQREAASAVVARARSDPSQHEPVGGYDTRKLHVSSGGSRVYVGNLAWSVTGRELKNHMEAVGEVSLCDVKAKASGRSRGYGIIAYRSAVDAQRAVQVLHGSELMGRPIFVREDRGAAGLLPDAAAAVLPCTSEPAALFAEADGGAAPAVRFGTAEANMRSCSSLA